MKTYRCVNGAYHDYACCETCWNTHPVAVKYFKGQDFSETEACKRIRLRNKKREFRKSAKAAGFTDAEASFLFERI